MSFALPNGVAPVLISDAARRMNTTMSLHLIAAQYGRWVAFKYEDGSSDGVTYETRREALKFKEPFEQIYFYLQVQRDGFNEDIAERLLRFHRKVYDRGLAMTDPETNLEPIMPDKIEDLMRYLTNG